MVFLKAVFKLVFELLIVAVIYTLVVSICLFTGTYLLAASTWKDQGLFQEEVNFFKKELSLPENTPIVVNYLSWYHPYSIGHALEGGWLNGAMFYDQESRDFKVFISTHPVNSTQLEVLAHELKHVYQHIYIPEEVRQADQKLRYEDQILEEQARLYAKLLTFKLKLHDSRTNSP